jgi:hypothetical protein
MNLVGQLGGDHQQAGQLLSGLLSQGGYDQVQLRDF